MLIEDISVQQHFGCDNICASQGIIMPMYKKFTVSTS